MGLVDDRSPARPSRLSDCCWHASGDLDNLNRTVGSSSVAGSGYRDESPGCRCLRCDLSDDQFCRGSSPIRGGLSPPVGIRSCGPIRANIGPADLALALGCEPRLDPTEEVVVKAIEHIVARARKKHIVPGIHTASPANAQKMIRQGFRFVTVGSDVRLLAAKASEVSQVMGRGPLAAKVAPTQDGLY